MKIVHKTHNPLLGRTQIEAEYEHVQQPTPKKDEVKKKIVDALQAEESRVAVKRVFPAYGGGKSRVIAVAYDTQEGFDAIEKIKKKAKKKEEKAAPKKE